MSEKIEIVDVTLEQVGDVAPLFDAYRVWYGADTDLDGARHFLSQRLRNNESQVFAAMADRESVGFTQLYPLFSSVSMESVWLLNDLYVTEQYRSRGVGTLLLDTATEFARELGAIRLELCTGVNNLKAQAVYDRQGWLKNSEFIHYSLSLK